MRELIGDNVPGRWSSTLTKAREYVALDALPRIRRRDGSGKVRPPSPKKMFAARVGLSERNVSRYFDVARAPLLIQQAFEKGKITLADASRVIHLPADRQKAIVEAITKGEEPGKAVKSQLRANPVAKTASSGDTERCSRTGGI